MKYVCYSFCLQEKQLEHQQASLTPGSKKTSKNQGRFIKYTLFYLLDSGKLICSHYVNNYACLSFVTLGLSVGISVSILHVVVSFLIVVSVKIAT